MAAISRSDDDIAEKAALRRLRAERRAQGLPPTVRDLTAYAKLARILKANDGTVRIARVKVARS